MLKGCEIGRPGPIAWRSFWREYAEEALHPGVAHCFAALAQKEARSEEDIVSYTSKDYIPAYGWDPQDGLPPRAYERTCECLPELWHLRWFFVAS